MTKKHLPYNRIINCHTHVFTGDHVPPYIAKTFLPWPFYYLVSVNLIVSAFRFYYGQLKSYRFGTLGKLAAKRLYIFKMFIARSKILSILVFMIGLFLSLQVFFIIAGWLSVVESPSGSLSVFLKEIENWLIDRHLLYSGATPAVAVVFVFLFLLFYKAGRNLVFFVLKRIWSFLGILPGKKTKELASRYINIGRFAAYQGQSGIFTKLQDQYPVGTGFVVLPMDMGYMDAGKSKEDYATQMAKLSKIKESKPDAVFPFVFADPRRMVEEGAKQFDYKVVANQVVLEPCFIKDYIEGEQFSGFKIYPALGYYPFDEVLLPLWKFAADKGLPIMTHCIRGTIFYRGTKKKEWDYHPVFTQADEKTPLMLGQIKNSEFINNFTHPLNFLCLLDEFFLAKLVGRAKDKRIRDLFGYDEKAKTIQHNLSHLKVCFGHFGGDDEWTKFLESDRDQYCNALVKYPNIGIRFRTNTKGLPKPGKIEQLWKYTDWYSIICSMMLQYDNVYADLSYIIHNNAIQPLLRQTLLNPLLREKVLFGTDFYVVRNHKSEKNMLAESLEHLCDADFKQIAVCNPAHFLYHT
ncbi:amidohydrolase family protein [Flavobacterium psychrotrophum]|uniref:amidohydrolase family protein n=1 Tax=Flavobacterium psychrotrophum TaxID=2294119 RepID=UPI000E31BEA3|nr:amidohydrolase family protein [Flavobacterium psychrotrophum]